MANKIYLSPSNQTANVYSYGNTNESVQCNRIAEFAKKALERCGFSVKKAVKNQDMNKSIRESNEWGADLHIPIHTNAYNGKVTGGTLVMLYSNNSANNKAGKAILDAVASISPGKDYSLRYNPELAELNATASIAVYLEVEFHDTEEGAKWIVENTESIGEAIAKGVCNYYDIKYIGSASASADYETGLLQALLRQAYAQGLCKTFIKPIDNKMSELVDKAIKECKASIGYNNTNDSIDLKFIIDLEHQINVLRIGKEDKLKGQLKEYTDKPAGDVNGDGEVNVKDVTALQKQIAGLE